ncbi:S8 family serine peptidase [Streptomyces chitinivorans]|uniref:S8 family serine peptidase n=1 Tax=Streptomyces chitinivorans TaxID=1257027 RepID=UPI00244A848B|nr:S8 family serine peptidase [Streptomyces chitinivorans]MDH2412189.1 S8 family serine peptidase [Streptomyces chitinivorans]
MTAGHDHGPRLPSRRMRRRLLSVLAVTGAWTVCLVGTAPVAQADDVRSQQWYLDAMRAEEMWKVSTGEGVKVAVIDSGVNDSTDALQGQVLPGEDMTGTQGEATDDYLGHGTDMAEVIAGTGKNGSVQGLAPGVKIVPYRIPLKGLGSKLKADGYVKAIRAAADSEAKVISMSFGGSYYDSAGAEAVEYALSKGKLLFASVGNDAEGKNKPRYPASYPGVVGVGATDEKGEVTGFSQYGVNVDLSAPGSEMPGWCDKSFQKYCVRDGGTSAATALASASAALIWAKNPDWTANQVLRVLVDTAGRKDRKEGASSVYIGYGAVRPRIHLLEGKGDPGDPGVNPIEATEPTLSPEASSSEGESDGKNDRDGAGGTAEDRKDQGGTAAAASEGDGSLWIYLGAGAAAAIVVAGAFVLVRRTIRGT